MLSHTPRQRALSWKSKRSTHSLQTDCKAWAEDSEEPEFGKEFSTGYGNAMLSRKRIVSF